ncbi:MAG: zinc ribbon domain-containing protein [Bacteriovoracaceae bacterium]|nr:zinc ribbon domain-containing protein [Bacteriovoracaceae bacterium]
MSIIFKCKYCNLELESKIAEPGGKIGCPNCKKQNTVPARPEQSILCTKCKWQIDSSTAEIHNKFIKCQHCGYWEDIPKVTRNEDIGLICPHCESYNNADAIYCRKCGKRLIEKTYRTVKYCEKCESEYEKDDDFCTKDGSKLLVKEIEVFPKEEAEKASKESNLKDEATSEQQATKDFKRESYSHKSNDFISKLSRGEFGLAKTFWVYGFAVSLILQIAIWIFEVGAGLVAMVIGYQVYQTALLLGTWRASNKYSGLKMWRVLAKITVFTGWLGWIWTLMNLFALISGA